MCVKSMLLSSHRKRRLLLVFEQQPFLVGRILHPGRSHGCCLVRAAGGSLPCGRYLLAPVTENKEESKCLMVLRVKPIPTRFPTNSLYNPMDNTPLNSFPSVCHPWGEGSAFHCLTVVGTIFVSNLSQFVIIHVRSFRKTFF